LEQILEERRYRKSNRVYGEEEEYSEGSRDGIKKDTRGDERSSI